MLSKYTAMKVVTLVVFAFVTLSSLAQDNRIVIYTLLKTNIESVPNPFPGIELEVSKRDEKAESEILCDEQVDAKSGEASCFINLGACNKTSPIQRKYVINLSDKMHYTPDPSRHVEVFIRGCEFVVPPEKHTITYTHNRSALIARNLPFFQSVQNFQNTTDISLIKDSVVAKTEAYFDGNYDNSTQSPFDTIKNSLELSIISNDAAKFYPEGSPEKLFYATRAKYFQNMAVLISNATLNYKVEPIVAAASSSEYSGGFMLSTSWELSDYYNNIVTLRNNKKIISELLNKINSEGNAIETLEQLDRLTSTIFLNTRAVAHMEQLRVNPNSG